MVSIKLVPSNNKSIHEGNVSEFGVGVQGL